MLKIYGRRLEGKDRDYHGYFVSVHYKIEIHNYFLEQLDKYIEIVKNEVNNLDNKDMLDLKNSIRMIGYFEAILSNAYSIMEDIAKITLPFFPKNNLSHSFHDQIKWFINNPNADHEYVEYLKSRMRWYYELQEIRTECIHFLSGSISFYYDPDKKWTPKYNIKMKSQRIRKMFRQEIISREMDFAHRIGRKMFEFLEFYGTHFLKKLDSESEVSLDTLEFDESGIKIIGHKKVKIKLREFLEGNIKLNEIRRVLMDTEKIKQ